MRVHRFGGLKLFGEWSRQTKMGGPGHGGHPQGHVARLATNKGEKGACAFSSSLHFSSLEDIMNLTKSNSNYIQNTYPEDL